MDGQGLLEAHPAVVDPAIRLRADPLDLVLVPGVDDAHVLVGVLAELSGLGRRPGDDLLDLGRLFLTNAGVDPLSLALRGKLHGACDLRLQ